MSDACCTNRVMGGEPFDLACPNCGHMNFLHPGQGNPSLAACVFCTLLADKDGA